MGYHATTRRTVRQLRAIAANPEAYTAAAVVSLRRIDFVFDRAFAQLSAAERAAVASVEHPASNLKAA